jgi:predicted acetyltransferase
VRYDLRLLTEPDSQAAWDLGALAFGYQKEKMPANWMRDYPGRRNWGAFDSSGRLIAKAVDREQGQWFGGRIVPASGVAGVAVEPESRGRGIARDLLTHLLVTARDRGAAISTLYPTTPYPYRKLGWEEAGALTYTAYPASTLAGVKGGKDISLRPAAGADFPAIQELYREMARAGTGLLERSGVVFDKPFEDVRKSFDGFTVATGPDGTVQGYASWERNTGYDATGKVTVYDLIGRTPEVTGSLLAMFGGWYSVAPTIALRLPTPDPAMFMISQAGAKQEYHQTWMIRIVDAVAAIAARGWPSYLDTAIDLELTDDVCAWNNGSFRLVLSGGSATLEPGGSGQTRFTPRGLALWYAGFSPAVLRRGGLLSGGTGSDELLQAATAGPPPAMLDYF